MAYENDVLTRNEDSELAVRVVTATEGTNNSSYDDVFTRDSNGKLAVRVVGSGGGDSHNKGYFATQAALEEAYPTGESGDYAIVGATDTVWLWDEDTSAWVDSDTKGEVVSVNGKTGTVVLNAADVGAVPQYSSMPVATADDEDAIVQYTGTTDANYTNGYFYKGTGTSVTVPESMVASNLILYGDPVNDVTITINASDLITALGTYTEMPHDDVISNLQNSTNWALSYDFDNNVVTSLFWEGWGILTSSADIVACFSVSTTGSYSGENQFSFTGTYTAEHTETQVDWERVDVQPTPSGLPDQTGQSGKFLTTDGTDASWSDKPLVNTATGTNSVGILGTATNNYEVCIGQSAQAGDGGGSNIAIGCYSTVHGNRTVCIGYSAKDANGNTYDSVVIGGYAETSAGYTVAVGNRQKTTAQYAIQIGAWSATNSDSNTFKVANHNGNYEMMSADGTIPEARLADMTNAAQGQVLTLDSNNNAVWATPGGGGGGSATATTATLAANAWSSNSQTVNVTGVTSSNIVFVMPAPATQGAYNRADIQCTAQGSGTLTFTCGNVPTTAITVNIIIM